jgi:hypothetical protein
LKFKTPRKLPIILEESMEYTCMSEENLKDHNMEPFGLGNARVLTNYASKISPVTRVRG